MQYKQTIQKLIQQSQSFQLYSIILYPRCVPAPSIISIPLESSITIGSSESRAPIQYKDDILPISHCGDKTILRPSYLHNGISYSGKMTYLYWIRAQLLLDTVRNVGHVGIHIREPPVQGLERG